LLWLDANLFPHQVVINILFHSKFQNQFDLFSPVVFGLLDRYLDGIEEVQIYISVVSMDNHLWRSCLNQIESRVFRLEFVISNWTNVIWRDHLPMKCQLYPEFHIPNWVNLTFRQHFSTVSKENEKEIELKIECKTRTAMKPNGWSFRQAFRSSARRAAEIPAIVYFDFYENKKTINNLFNDFIQRINK